MRETTTKRPTANAVQRQWLGLVRTPMGAAGVAGVLLLVVVAVVAPMAWGDAATTENIAQRNQPSSSEHLLGTDAIGRDMLARVLVATRLTLLLTLLATLVGVSTGLLLGALPSILGHRAGRVITGTVNLLVAFPGLLLALFLAVIFGVGATGAVLAIGFAMAPYYARLTQTLAASIAGRDYVRAARVVGVGPLRRLTRHVLPNIGEPLVIQATLGAGAALVSFAGLSFLGLGVQPPGYDWGRLLNEGLDRIYTNPVAALAPGVAVTVAGIVLQLLGESLAAVVGLRSGGTRRYERPTMFRPAPRRTAGPAVDTGTGAVLRVEDLRVSFPGELGPVDVVDGVSLELACGETVGIVGESGAGKSMTALALAGLVPAPGVTTASRLSLVGHEFVVDGRPVFDERSRESLGTSLAMVFQDPMTALNPVLRIGRQLAEVAEVHRNLSRSQASQRAVDRLGDVRIPRPERRARQYPHEFSGGMRQRATIAMGLMGEPRLIIADEPTTALDVTVQQQVIDLLLRVHDEAGAAILLISHDIAVVSMLCERVLVMYGGTVVEDLPTGRLLTDAVHPYTRALLATVPQMDADRTEPLPTIPGRPPSPGSRPAGCPFVQRCTHSGARCETERPVLEELGARHHRVACWHPQGATGTPMHPVDTATGGA